MPHPRLEIASPLVGTWRGLGHGLTPRPFDYTDTWEFVDLGKPFLSFVERTTRDGAPAHTESGYLRFVDDVGTLEIVTSLPTGQTELGTGSVRVEDGVLTLVTDAAVQSTPSATQVTRLVRTFTLRGDTLEYRLDMDWLGGSQEWHLSSTLTRGQG
jgi:hypothetical protein